MGELLSLLLPPVLGFTDVKTSVLTHSGFEATTVPLGPQSLLRHEGLGPVLLGDLGSSADLTFCASIPLHTHLDLPLN